jgi:hypothetical protein
MWCPSQPKYVYVYQLSFDYVLFCSVFSLLLYVNIIELSLLVYRRKGHRPIRKTSALQGMLDASCYSWLHVSGWRLY